MRMASPRLAIDIPTAIVRSVGSARTITSRPNTPPSATRRRARPATNGANTARLRGETALDCGDHFRSIDVEQAHARQPAATQVMALADRVARDSDVERRHRTVSRRACRTVEPDDRRADGSRDVRRAG